MSYRMKLAVAVGLALMLAGCASRCFQSTWKNPEAAPVAKEKGATVVAVVMAEDKYIRQGAEDALAQELTKRGYKGVASYLILSPEETMDENLAKAAFEKIGALRQKFAQKRRKFISIPKLNSLPRTLQARRFVLQISLLVIAIKFT